MSDWPFTMMELTAGLRRYLADPTLRVLEVAAEPLDLTLASTPTRGLGIDVERCGHGEHYSYLLTQPRPVRYGVPGGGQREAGFHRSSRPPLTFVAPEMVTADPRGLWILLEPYPSGYTLEGWTADHYRQAVINLAYFHDRYWELDEDLANYPWVSFPLANDLETICMAAAISVEKVIHDGCVPVLCSSVEYMTAVAHIISQADEIARELRAAPQTLLHGDYWPGNISIDEDNRHVVYDWQMVGVGPGLLDLVTFIRKSERYIDSMPVDAEELIALYRYVLADQLNFVVSNAEWQRLWDYAVMWRFLHEMLTEWASTPAVRDSIDEQRLKRLWLDPVARATDRWLPKYALI
ncbi:MAG TPA: phosphotransferase [Anaerolineales bacterium]|nr:phosphotransferase [Anaerolineales bacterium]